MMKNKPASEWIGEIEIEGQNETKQVVFLSSINQWSNIADSAELL